MGPRRRSSGSLCQGPGTAVLRLIHSPTAAPHPSTPRVPERDRRGLWPLGQGLSLLSLGGGFEGSRRCFRPFPPTPDGRELEDWRERRGGSRRGRPGPALSSTTHLPPLRQRSRRGALAVPSLPAFLLPFPAPASTAKLQPVLLSRLRKSTLSLLSASAAGTTTTATTSILLSRRPRARLR